MYKLAILLLVGAASVFGQDPVECVQGRFGTDTEQNYFDHSADYYTRANITDIAIYHAEFIHGINVAYGGEWTGVHGGSSNDAALSVISLGSGQRINRIDIGYGQYVDQLTIYVDNVPFGPYGGYGGTRANVSFCGSLYFKGNSGAYLDRLNIYTECTFCP